MRFLYATIGVLGGVLSIAATYLFLLFAMFMGGGGPNLQSVILYVIGAFLLASLINLVAGFLDPRRPLTPRLLLASASIWVLAGAFLGVFSYFASTSTVSVVETLKFVAVLLVPALLPLAAWAFARWKLPVA
ncbi:hypothetical protein GIW81_16720 [Hyphomicrobium sp. xq]|uniref:Uncharacterized protein n=1 Tax=Hyphomicrobium album TaxID=2665159 RepID=A0A6I3KLF6_9HYPH|nr:hypothetical protein [Hyphomicrobium album]MTD95984.1 hypothetical protein [Hyphomicrobium album]